MMQSKTGITAIVKSKPISMKLKRVKNICLHNMIVYIKNWKT